MKPLLVLLIVFSASVVFMKLIKKTIDLQYGGRIAMASMLVFTAIGHFVYSKGMEAMVPDFLPNKAWIVLLTGILEIAFAISLLIPPFQKMTGWLLICFFITILPANIKAALENIDYQTGMFNGPGLNYLWFRVPLQILFISWVYLSTLKSQEMEVLKLTSLIKKTVQLKGRPVVQFTSF